MSDTSSHWTVQVWDKTTGVLVAERVFPSEAEAMAWRGEFTAGYGAETGHATSWEVVGHRSGEQS